MGPAPTKWQVQKGPSRQEKGTKFHKYENMYIQFWSRLQPSYCFDITAFLFLNQGMNPLR